MPVLSDHVFEPFVGTAPGPYDTVEVTIEYLMVDLDAFTPLG
jgi:hypothetical protein